MEIKYIGQQTFLLKGKKETVLINPEKDLDNKTSSRIVVYNQPHYEELRSIDEKISIMGPGEYEVGGIEVCGYSAGAENTMYTIVVDKVIVGVLGKLEEQLSDKKIDKITGVDVLVVDISNSNGIGSKALLDLAKKWGANYVVPVGYGNDDTELKKFLDVADAEGLEPIEILKVEKDSLPDGTEVVILKEGK